MDPNAIQYPAKTAKEEIFDDDEAGTSSPTDDYEEQMQMQVVSLASREDTAFAELLDTLMRKETSTVYMRRQECPWSFDITLPELLENPVYWGKVLWRCAS
ncbi:unnamed protein product, partial [Mesorhabditis spiculigera]